MRLKQPDFIDELVPPLGSPSSSLATTEDEGACTPMHVSVHISAGPIPMVVIHDIGILDSGASGDVNLNLDRTHDYTGTILQ